MFSRRLRQRRRQIPRADWGAFLDEVNQRCAGWLASLYVLRADGGSQAEIHGLPLTLVSANGRVELRLGRPGQIQFQHDVTPCRLVLEHALTDSVRFHLDGSDGSRTVAEVRPAPIKRPVEAGRAGPARPPRPPEVLRFRHADRPPSPAAVILTLAAAMLAAAVAYNLTRDWPPEPAAAAPAGGSPTNGGSIA